jgi:calcium-translocating P-type ATPase
LNNHYQKTIEDLFSELQSSPEGIAEKEALLRTAKHGLNRLQKVKKTSILLKFLHQFYDILALILFIASILAYLTGGLNDALIIIGIILLNAIIGFVQEYKAERILAAFKKNLPSYSKVIRGGNLKRIFSINLVPGDIIVLEAGDIIAADARLFESFNLEVNEFSLTGESQTRTKDYKIESAPNSTLLDIKNCVFMGTEVVGGEAKALVVATGMETEYGKIAKFSQEIREESTPLQKEMMHTGRMVAKISLGVALFMLILLYFLGRDIKESMLFAIAAGVAMVPEGLPAAMSVALSLGARGMLKKKALVKTLYHAETLGSTTVICTDKTGTLTSGKLKVVSEYVPASLGSSVFQKTLNHSIEPSANVEEIGDPLEKAMVEYLHVKACLDIPEKDKRVLDIPFSSERKMMSSVWEEEGGKIVYSKGAVTEILNHCKLTASEREKIFLENDKMASSGHKVIALAFNNLSALAPIDRNSVEENLIFVGLLGFEDPPRKEVREALALCESAGIRVYMLTGDYKLTALSIAKEIGLAHNSTPVLSGEDLHKMDDNRLKEALKGGAIFAQIQAGQKLRIVQNLQEMGEIVAVTGDGVNDVPALVKGNIGIAMGKIGTEVTKESADMILLDDNFATIVKAIKEGRRIFDNAKKIIYYVFSSNSGELFAPLFGVLLGLPMPLIAIQILAIDLGTDVLPSLALSFEKEEVGIMQAKPRSSKGGIMNWTMVGNLLKTGLTMGILALIVFTLSLYIGGWRYGEAPTLSDINYKSALGASYATIVICQFANILSLRGQKISVWKNKITSNLWLIWAEIVSFILLFAILFAPILQKVFYTGPLKPVAWIGIVFAFFIFLIITEYRKSKSAII